jgi:hypothetical protein
LSLPPPSGTHSQLLYARKICPQRKEARPRLYARNPFNLNFLTRLCGLMVRRWRLIGYFPILYNPSSIQPHGEPPHTPAPTDAPPLPGRCERRKPLEHTERRRWCGALGCAPVQWRHDLEGRVPVASHVSGGHDSHIRCVLLRAFEPRRQQHTCAAKVGVTAVHASPCTHTHRCAGPLCGRSE